MANLLYRSISGGSSTSSGTVDVTAPSGVANLDLEVLYVVTYVVTASAVTHTTPSGWTFIRSDTQSVLGGAYEKRTSLYWKYAGASEGTTTISFSGSTASAAGEIYCADNPLGASAYDTNTYNTGSGTAISGSTLTTFEANEMILGFASTDGGGSASTFTTSDLTERDDQNSVTVGEVFQASQGASGAKSWTASLSGSWSAYLVSFRSEAAGGGSSTSLAWIKA